MIQSAGRKKLPTKNICCPNMLGVPAKLSLRNRGVRKIFPDTETLQEFFTPRPALQEMLKVLQAEMKGC